MKLYTLLWRSLCRNVILTMSDYITVYFLVTDVDNSGPRANRDYQNESF